MQRILTLFLLLWVASCGAAIERSEVEQRFRTLFACASPHVVGEAGGYLVEGCGVTAHFRCIEDARAYQQRQQGILGAALASDTCVLEHSERAPLVSARERVERNQTSDGQPRLRAKAALRGGHLQAIALPSRDPEYVVLVVNSIERLHAEPCASDLFRDGSPVRVAQVKRTSEHELRMAIPAASLRELGKAQRFSGRACGFEFELEDEGREALSLLEMRFREELVRLAPATQSPTRSDEPLATRANAAPGSSETPSP